MNILVTGGNGSLGRELVPLLLAHDHDVTVLDRELGALARLESGRLTLQEGRVEERDAVWRAVRGAQAVLHLAWSFSDAPLALVDVDLRGHQLLLDACRANGVAHLVYASSAVVYGKPRWLPVDEEHPLDVLHARKPAYAFAKATAEALTSLAARSGGPRATILRFWWAFGADVSGRHLREMLSAAAAGERVRVPAECGGSFLTVQDLARAVEAALAAPPAADEVLNLASAYVGWDDVARLVAEVVGSRAGVEVVPREAYEGPAFLAETWQLDTRRARERLGLAAADPPKVREQLGQAIRATWHAMQAALPQEGGP
jgi:UDP-glucose 4-epimerase